ncbi:cell division protein SepF [Limosilactobacillus agrestis]|uniref:Cell division protein SepF n=1 Tax=Limosilactobacillus agrestis TaxID=2759748 RepID=A0A7W3YKP5_9LACO|nr:cell division protein SepF [Limosilactobacillus agrestis]MBB1095253.1 cell division protein SepF [Limosilactobacillus agrestis]MBB1099380.1 cell division protein SepF [Limosilactobacillus agrestis]MCD7112956.1 cell division protein SepF [Limosilactobacillus agrestis]MCD7126778.1 cell division protein SepF [Limosilactobacillus agrestis]MCD7129661.1 cell division protein SepF [Limosilactobacillus agrestis]
MAANFLKSLFGEEDIDEQDGLYGTSEQVPTPANTSNKVVSINSGHFNQMSQISLYEPRLYADVKQIASQLLEGHAVIVNFTQMDANVAARLVDFLNGTVFAIDGEMKRIGKEIFLCTPKNYEISGSLTSNLKNDGDKF